MRSNLDQAFVFDSILKSGRIGASRTILTGNYTIVRGSNPTHFLDPNGSTRSVFLPEPREGDFFFVFHVGASGSLLIRDHLSVLLATVTADGGVGVFSSEDEWGFLSGALGSAAGLPLVRSASGTITVDANTDDHILIGAGVATLNLPDSDDRTEGRGYLFVDDTVDGDVNAKTIVPDGVQTIMGLSTVTVPLGGAVEIFPRPSGGWYGKVF